MTGTCKLCQRGFSFPPCARHKKFCSKECRDSYHARQRELAARLLSDYQQEKDYGTGMVPHNDDSS